VARTAAWAPRPLPLAWQVNQILTALKKLRVHRELDHPRQNLFTSGRAGRVCSPAAGASLAKESFITCPREVAGVGANIGWETNRFP